MNVLVTGAAGLTASALVRRLGASDHHVLALTRHPGTVAGASEVVVGDCRDGRTMGPLLERSQAVVHVAGISYGPDIARIGALTRPRTVIIVSSSGVYSQHRASALLYRVGEEALSAARPDAILIRPTMIYGSPRDRNIHHLIRFAQRWGFLPIAGPGDRRIQPVHYEDLAFALAAMVDRPAPGRVLDAGGGSTLNVRDLLTAILYALDRPARLVPVPMQLGLAAARLIDAMRGSRWSERLQRLDEDRAVDDTELRRLTGIAPRSFESGVREEVRVMRTAAPMTA